MQKNVLQRFEMAESKPVVTPMNGQLELSDLEGDPFDSSFCRQLIGCGMYLSVGTRPDISFAVTRLAQFIEAPTQTLWIAAKRVLRYQGPWNLLQR